MPPKSQTSSKSSTVINITVNVTQKSAPTTMTKNKTASCGGGGGGGSTKNTTHLQMPVKSDGTKDKRYSMPQFIKNDGTRDMRTTVSSSKK